jgi:hypothetical protein
MPHDHVGPAFTGAIEVGVQAAWVAPEKANDTASAVNVHAIEISLLTCLPKGVQHTSGSFDGEED